MSPTADLRTLARRFEAAQAAQLERTGPTPVHSLDVAGGRVVFKGSGSIFSLALGVGLDGPVGPAEVERIEAHLGADGGPVRIEVSAPADGSLAAELAQRGYRVERFHLVWWRDLAPLAQPEPALEARPMRPDEEGTWIDLFSQAFLGRPAATPEAVRRLQVLTRAEGSACFLGLSGGIPRAVAMASAHGGVAQLTGAGVPAPFRGRGLQLALVVERLRWARERGCDVAASVTDPGTASQRTLEKAGFRCAYPKAVLVREPR